MMTDATLIETLQFGPDDAPEQKYEIYGLPELRDLPAEAREHCERHWQNSQQ